MTRLPRLPRPKAVLFDWDGTLVDTFSFLAKAHGHTCQHFGLTPLTEDDYRPLFGQPRDILYDKLYGVHQLAARTVFEEYVLKNHVQETQILDGAAETLEVLHSANIPMGVVTNKRKILVQAECAVFGWNDYFQIIIGAGDAPEDKPSGAPLLMALDAMTCSAGDDVVYVGDTQNDLDCARNAGCLAVILTNHFSRMHFQNVPETTIFVDSFADFISAMEKQ